LGLIYKLICPIEEDIKYIGQTSKTLKYRLSGHINKTKSKIKDGKKLTHKENWIKKLIESELIDDLIIEEIEECDDKLLDQREIFWISKYKYEKKLTNSTDGGKQPRNYTYEMSDETKMKISNGLKKSNEFQMAVRSKDRCEKISNANRGRTKSDNVRKKISESLKGKISGDKNPFYNKKHTDDTKEKLSEYASNRTGEKNSFYGKKHTDETKEKIRKKLKNKPKKVYYIYDSEGNLVISGESKELLEFFNSKTHSNIIRNCDKDKKYKGYYIKSK
jgi:group I intron endonuclease